MTPQSAEHLPSACRSGLMFPREQHRNALSRRLPTPLLVFLCGVFITLLAGCGSGGSFTLRSVAGPATLSGQPPTLAYFSSDTNTADVYMTDLPRAALDPSADLAGVSGVLIHIHMFIRPMAGETPIANSACSATVRCVVVADGNLGVYGGGGFLAPAESPGGSTFGGRIRDASCRVTTKAASFADRLGASMFAATFRVPRDQALAKQIERRLATILDSMPPPAPITSPRP